MPTNPLFRATARRERTKRLGIASLGLGAVFLIVDAVLFISGTNVGWVPAVVSFLWIFFLGAGIAFLVSAAVMFRQRIP